MANSSRQDRPCTFGCPLRPHAGAIQQASSQLALAEMAPTATAQFPNVPHEDAAVSPENTEDSHLDARRLQSLAVVVEELINVRAASATHSSNSLVANPIGNTALPAITSEHEAKYGNADVNDRATRWCTTTTAKIDIIDTENDSINQRSRDLANPTFSECREQLDKRCVEAVSSKFSLSRYATESAQFVHPEPALRDTAVARTYGRGAMQTTCSTSSGPLTIHGGSRFIPVRKLSQCHVKDHRGHLCCAVNCQRLECQVKQKERREMLGPDAEERDGSPTCLGDSVGEAQTLLRDIPPISGQDDPPSNYKD